MTRHRLLTVARIGAIVPGGRCRRGRWRRGDRKPRGFAVHRFAFRFALVTFAAALVAVGGADALPPNGPSPNIVISQVYGGGGNSGAPFNADFIELFNRGSTAQSVAGWSVQYASATGTGNLGA